MEALRESAIDVPDKLHQVGTVLISHISDGAIRVQCLKLRFILCRLLFVG